MIQKKKMSLNIVLWHGGYYHSEWIKSPTSDTQEYFNTIIQFAKNLQKAGNNITVMMTIPDPVTNPNDMFLSMITSFFNDALTNNISIGFQLTADPSSPSNLSVFSKVFRSITPSPEHFEVGLDTESFGLKAVDVSEFAQKYSDTLNIVVGKRPNSIAISGQNAVKPNWNQPLVNVYEMYGEPELNDPFSSNVNQPSKTFQELSFPSISKLSSPTVPVWFSFDMACHMSQGSTCDCVASSFGISAKKNPCGVYNVMYNWTLQNTLQFLEIVKKSLFSESSSPPTFVLYQTDFLPISWVHESESIVLQSYQLDFHVF